MTNAVCCSFLPTSITVSLLSLTLEAYSILRLLFIIAPPSFPLRRRLDALTDVRILRITSLILYDMIIMVPNAINTTYTGDTVPYSISALIVLCKVVHLNYGLQLCKANYHNYQMPSIRCTTLQNFSYRSYHELQSNHPFLSAIHLCAERGQPPSKLVLYIWADTHFQLQPSRIIQASKIYGVQREYPTSLRLLLPVRILRKVCEMQLSRQLRGRNSCLHLASLIIKHHVVDRGRNRNRDHQDRRKAALPDRQERAL